MNLYEIWHHLTKISDLDFLTTDHWLPKFSQSVVKSERLKFQIWLSDQVESLEDATSTSSPASNSPTFASDVKVEPRAGASIPIDISSGVSGKWLFDATGDGCTAISDIDAIALHWGAGAAASDVSL